MPIFRSHLLLIFLIISLPTFGLNCSKGVTAETNRLPQKKQLPESKVASVFFSPESGLPPNYRSGPSKLAPSQLFQKALSTLSEQEIIRQILLRSDAVGVSKEGAGKILPLLDKIYSKIKKDPLMKNLESSLPHCYGPETPTKGHYYVYWPPPGAYTQAGSMKFVNRIVFCMGRVAIFSIIYGC